MIKCDCFGVFKSGRTCVSIGLGGACLESLEVECEHQVDEGEVWKPVVGYEDSYEVSSFGRVRSLDRILEDKLCRRHMYHGCIIKPYCHKGHVAIMLSEGGEHKLFQLTRLVWEAFMGGELPKFVRHRDGDHWNNRPGNLYSTSQQLAVTTACEVELKSGMEVILDGELFGRLK
jgi:hypothetical protein